MGYSNDLRVRVIHVVESGVAARAAARQFVIGDATAIRWVKRWRETGSVEAKSIKGQSRSPLKRHEEWLLDLVRQEPDLTLEEIQRRLLFRLQLGQRGDLRPSLIVANSGDAREAQGEPRTILRAPLYFIVGHFDDDLGPDAHGVAVVLDLQGS